MYEIAEKRKYIHQWPASGGLDIHIDLGEKGGLLKGAIELHYGTQRFSSFIPN